MWEEYPFPSYKEMNGKPCVGISACLSGEKVRYDGQSKLQPDLLSFLEPIFLLKPLCPEVAIGMGTPRPPIQLTTDGDSIDAVFLDDQETSFAHPLNQYGREIVEQHNHLAGAKDKLCGYVFKSRSPSCGAGSTPIFSEGVHIRFGDGIYAHTIKQNMPWLPVMEEEELVHANSRERFGFLVYLVSDFYFTLDQGGNGESFSKRHAQLIKALPQAIRHKLESGIARSKDTQQALRHYLAPLINYLEEMSHHEIAAIVKGAG